MQYLKRVRPVQFVVLLVIVFMASILGIQGARIHAKLSILQSAPHDNVQWNLAQVETELLVVLNAILAVRAEPSNDIKLNEFKRRFDIYYSRIASIDSNQYFAELHNLPAFATSIGAISDVLDRSIPLIDGNDVELRASIGALNDAMSALRSDARNLALIGVDTFARQADLQRLELATLLKSTTQTGGILFAAMLIAIFMMLRQRQLAQHRAKTVRESRSRYASTVDASLDAIIVADANGIILEFNPAAERTFGYSRARAVGSDMSELIIPETMRDAHRVGMKRFSETAERRVVGKGRVELQAIDASGRQFPIEISIGSAETAEDLPILISNIRDISERKRIEGELLDARDTAQQADRAKSRFLAVTSHEMRTPLNGVMAVLDLLATTKMTNTQRDYLDTAVTSGEILQHHIDSVLDITHIEADSIELKPQRFNVLDLLHEVQQSYTITADKNWNTIEVHIDDNVDDVTLDRNRLRQILLNLVGNALKFTEYGLVKVHVSLQESEEDRPPLNITVTDTGCGIAQENIDRIFDDFVTLDASYGRKANGYGLGLSICRRITTIMGGNISVSSEIDKGTTFNIYLPQAETEHADYEIKVVEDTASHDFDLDVLIVEDNETNRIVASAMLEQFGCRTQLAVDGEDGLKKAAQGRFDLVFMDLSMPKMDGLEAVEWLRERAIVPPEVPIVFLTAHAMKDEQDRMTAAGVDHVLMKPLRRRNLASLLKELFPEKADPKQHSDMNDETDKTDTVVDFSFIKEMRDLMDPAEVASAIDKFCDEVAVGITTLDEMNNAGDLEGARMLAHRIGGSSAMFGGLALSEALRLVQELAHQQDKGAIKELMPDIEVLSTDIVNALRAEASN